MDLTVQQLLCSKLLHDLIAPTSSLSNGVELIESLGGVADLEVLDLMKESAHTLSEKLKFFRVVFGASGDSTLSSLDKVARFAKPLLSLSAVTCTVENHYPRELTKNEVRLLGLLMLMVAQQATKACTLHLESTAQGITLTAKALAIPLKADHADLLKSTASDIHGLTVYTILPWLTATTAKAAGYSLAVEHNEVGLIVIKVNRD